MDSEKQGVSTTQEKTRDEWVENERENFSALEVSINKKLLRKLDAVLLPLLALAYLLAYMVSLPSRVFRCTHAMTDTGWQDRNNIGNARIMGLETNLHLSSQQYYNSVMVFCTLSSLISVLLVICECEQELTTVASRWIFSNYLSWESSNPDYWT